MKLKIKHKATQHLLSLQEAGNHYSVHLVNDAKTIPLTRFLRRFIIKRLGHRAYYKIFWISTTQGTMFCVSTDKTVQRIMADFFQESVTLQHCTTATPLYVGRNKNELANAIAFGVESYKSKGNHAHSIGGSVLTGVNK